MLSLINSSTKALFAFTLGQTQMAILHFMKILSKKFQRILMSFHNLLECFPNFLPCIVILLLLNSKFAAIFPEPIIG